jgi:CheY-like chemotaxis protein/signal transduction histidine kinase/HAMP domain-containing protein
MGPRPRAASRKAPRALGNLGMKGREGTVVWISIRAKLIVLLAAITLLWVALIAGSMLLGLRQTAVLRDLEDRMLPRLQLGPELRLEFDQLAGALRESISTRELEPLRAAELHLDRLMRTVSASPSLDTGDAASVRAAVTAYYVSAETVARKLIAGEAGEAVVSDLAELQTRQAHAGEVLRQATAFDRAELTQGFALVHENIATLNRFRLLVGVFGLLVAFGLSVSLSRGLFRTVANLSDGFARFGRGDFSRPIPVRSHDELGAAAEAANQMASSLGRLADQRTRDDWITGGLAGLSEQLRGDLSPTETASRALQFLAERVGALAGAVYAIESDDTFTVSYRFGVQSTASTPNGETATDAARERFQSAEGLVGRAAQSNDVLVVEDVPPGYLLESGLGSAPPQALLFVPLTRGGVTVGVLEFALFGKVSDDALALLRSIREPLAVTFEVTRSRAGIRELLEQTQRQAELLARQETELRLRNQHLQEQQEELRLANEELESQRRALSEQNAELAQARENVQKKVEELARVSSYKSQFLANMSHELRTPLNSMLLLSHLLSENESGNLTAKQVEHIRTIHDAGKDLLDLVNQVLDLAKIESGKQEVHLETVSIDHLAAHCRKVFTPLAEAKGLRFRVERAPELPATVTTDPQRAERILTNLVANAIKYTEEGEVRVLIQRPTPGVRFARADLSPRSAIAFVVSDTGVGIGAESHERVFLPFEQLDGHSRRRHTGTGLGLAIARESALLLGGDLHLQSAPGRGSTFTWYLPEAPPAGIGTQASPVRPGNGAAASPRRAHLLIIEDDADLAHLLVQLIGERGFDASWARSGEEGLALARQHRPHGIVLDISLPDIDGWQVLDRLRDDPATRDIPVHFLSGSDRPERVLASSEAVGYLTKPATRDDLVTMIQTLAPPVRDERRRILVIEDDSAVGEATVDLLRDHGFDAEYVSSANAAMSALEAGAFGCVVLDLGLPDVDGLGLLQRLRKRVDIPTPQVIVHTGRALTKRETRELEEYAQAVVVKDGQSAERLLEEVRLFVGQVRDMLPKGTSPNVASPGTDVRLDGAKLLLADDDMRTVYALSALLRGKGADVLVADTGAEALETLANNPDVDGVLMDVMMPEMDGYEAMRRIREDVRFRQLPVVALTARAMKGERERCLEAGASDYLSKPVDTSRLLKTVERWPRRQASHGS